MTTIGLVGCAAAKLTRPAPARELYTSQLFRKAAAYAEEHSDRWFILSALHGLVSPETVLEPYNVKLGHKSGPPIWQWADRVAEQLQAASWPARVPMAGMGIGQQLGYLTAQLRTPRPRTA